MFRTAFAASDDLKRDGPLGPVIGPQMRQVGRRLLDMEIRSN
ncbi:MAG: hypothetical protein ACREO9_10485 [Lysobacterales bacterium]